MIDSDSLVAVQATSPDIFREPPCRVPKAGWQRRQPLLDASRRRVARPYVNTYIGFALATGIRPHPADDAIDGLLKLLMSGGGLVMGVSGAVSTVMLGVYTIATSWSLGIGERIAVFVFGAILIAATVSPLLWAFGIHDFGIESRPHFLE